MFEDLDKKLDSLMAGLRRLDGALVAYSGGVDSAFLAAAAFRALGSRAVAATAVSPSLAASELEEAKRTAAWIGVRHELISTDELENESYRRNEPNRCYFCKSELFAKLRPLADQLRLQAVVFGAIVDDRSDVRPGAQAAKESGARAPLDEAELTKAEVREISRLWGLPTWDKPSAPCLASRVPFGTEVTLERLSTIEKAEAALRSLGFREFRVRHHEETARVELAEKELRTLLEKDLRDAVVNGVKAAGYRWVTLDLAGLKSGGFNKRRR
jgi:uncharacterized protein